MKARDTALILLGMLTDALAEAAQRIKDWVLRMVKR